MDDDYAKIIIINYHSRQLTARRGPAAGAAVTDNLQNIDYDAFFSRGGSKKMETFKTFAIRGCAHIT